MAFAQTIRFSDFDPEQMREVIDGADLEHTILTSADCFGSLHRTVCDAFSADGGFYSFPVVVRGQFPKDRICIGISRGAEVPTWVNGIELCKPGLQLYAENSEMLYRAGATTRWVGITATREDIQREALSLLGRELILPRRGVTSLELSVESEERLIKITRDPDYSAFSINPSAPGATLLREVVRIIGEAQARMNGKPHDSRSFEMVSRADALLRRSVGTRYCSESICKTLGVSERNLQIHFREAFQMSPKSYFTSLSLNRVRSQLGRIPKEPGAVARVATSFGFEHLGRFSENYRKLFNESPSETLGSQLNLSR